MALMSKTFKEMIKSKKQKKNHVHNVEFKSDSDFDLDDFKCLEVEDSDNES
jgi:hypothetical protein